MAYAKLHIICGNCGNNTDLTYEIVKDLHDYGDTKEDGVVIRCGNCSTTHDIRDTINYAS